MNGRATYALVAHNVAAYIWVAFTGGFGDTNSLIAHGALYGPLVARGEYWRIVTSAFLHGGLMHIGLNMFALVQVGTYLETLVGSVRMLAIYTIALIGSGIAVFLFSPNDVTVGASGAIFGIFGALVAIGLRLGPRGRGLITQTLPIVGLNLAFGFSMPNISNAGHIGGLASGFLAGLAIFMTRRTESAQAEPDAAESVAGQAASAEHETHAGDGALPFEVEAREIAREEGRDAREVHAAEPPAER
jgi:rhomboid protease GluP